MPCLSCHLEYTEHPSGGCYNHVHWAGYVGELEKKSSQNYGIIAEQDYQYYDDPDTFVKLELTRDDLVSEWASILVSIRGYGYEGDTYSSAYHFRILRDGRDVSEEEKTFLLNEVMTLATKAKAAIDLEKKRMEEEKQRQQEEENDKLSRAMYESLKKKYEKEI